MRTLPASLLAGLCACTYRPFPPASAGCPFNSEPVALDEVVAPWTVSPLEAVADFGTRSGPVTFDGSDIVHWAELSVSEVSAASIDGPEPGAPECGTTESWFNLQVSWRVVFDDVVGSVDAGSEELHVLEDGTFRVQLSQLEFAVDGTGPDVSEFAAVGDQPVDRIALAFWGDPGVCDAELEISFLPGSEPRNVRVEGIWQGALLAPK